MKKSTIAIISVLCTLVVCLGAFCTYLVFNDETNQDIDNLNEERQEKTYEYKKSSTIFISYTTDSSDVQFSPELYATCYEIFHSNQIKREIDEQYSDVKYTLELYQIGDTELSEITVVSDSENHSTAICNLATDIFKEKVMNLIKGVDCRVIDYAR